MTLTIDDNVSNAQGLFRAIDLATAVHRRRPARPDLTGRIHIGWISAWLLPAVGGPIAALILGCVLAMTPAAALMSPLLCKPGERVKMVWTASGNKSRGNLYCVGPRGDKRSEMLCLLPMLILFNSVYLPLSALLGIRASIRVRRESAVEEDWIATTQRSAYR